MKIFLSWSGDRSFAIAKALNQWLPQVIHAVEPFFSPKIERGLRWANKIDEALESTRFGIICLTPDNLASSWLHYEAGALAKTPGSKIWTLLHGLEYSQVPAPLGRFQHTLAKRSDVLDLLRSINKTLEATGHESRTDRALVSQFKTKWPSLEKKLAAATKIVDSPNSDAFLGIEKVYRHLADAHNLPKWLKEAKKIQVLKTWFPETDHIRVGLQAAIKGGATAKLLLAHPDSFLLEERSRNAHNEKGWLGPIVVYQAVADIHKLLSPRSTKVEFRFYDSWPGCPAIWYGDQLSMGFYFRNKPSPEWPWVRVTKDSEFARILNEQFDQLWDSVPAEWCLKTAKQRQDWLNKNKKWHRSDGRSTKRSKA